jgi:hypothetical protein
MNPVVQKIAFIHYAKVAGRYIDAYLRQKVFENKSDCLAEQQVKTFNSWTVPFSMGRDWSEEELLRLAANRYSAQYPSPEEVRSHYQCWTHDYLARQYVHNHHHFWSLLSVREFRKRGWFTFMFIRDPAELLCSLWTWTQKNTTESPKLQPVIKPEHLTVMSLDHFIQEILRRPNLSAFYALPDYVDEIEYVSEFTDENFYRFLQKYFDHSYQPETLEIEQRCASGNPGYAAYRNQGLISEETRKLLDGNQEVCRVRELIASK